MNRTDADVWLFNEARSNPVNHVWAKRADVIFQMHEEAIWRNPENRNDPNHLHWLNTQIDTVIYMQEQYPDVPASVCFPLDEIVDRFKVRYFTSSVSYAIALACYKGYKRIELYGVEMETDTEYQYQRDGVTLWIGVALGLGIDVDAHIGIFDQPLYGYEGEVVLPYEAFGKRVDELMPRVIDQTAKYKAAAVNMESALNEMLDTDNRPSVQKCSDALLDIGTQLGIADGARQENERYKGKADSMRNAAGEFLFSRQEFESSAKNLHDRAVNQIAGMNGVGGQLDLIMNSIAASARNSPKRKKMIAQCKQIFNRYFMFNNQAAVYRGAAQENMRYMSVLDKHIRAAGGSKAEEVLLERLRNVRVVEA